MLLLYVLTGIALIFSFIGNKNKTATALKVAIKKFTNILPAFLVMICLSSLFLYLLPEKSIVYLLDNEEKSVSVFFASIVGSILLLPGFIAFPLSGLLLQKGVSYMVISAFTSTLMMVGIMTYPVEVKYFGVKFTLIRNLVSLVIALIVALITGIAYGELF